MNAEKKWIVNTRRYLSFLFIIFLPYGLCFAKDGEFQEQPKTIVITGASGELGGAAAKLLAKDYDLILTGRDVSKLKILQEELRKTSPHQYDICTLDFINNSSRQDFEGYLKSNGKSIAGLVLITPRPQFYGKALMQEENDWFAAFQSTFTGPIEVMKAILPYLVKPSKIVVIAGTTSIQLQPEFGPACVIRRMWTTYVKALSHELGPAGISVNALSPGIVLTNFHQERIQNVANEAGVSYDSQMANEVGNIPLHRHGKPQEVAQAIQFLISAQSDFINGVNLIQDGGFTLSY